MALQVAHISEFDIENDDIIEYCERFDCYLEANKVEGENIRKSTFIACIGSKAWK